ncbi:MAG TPA: glycosyltransferase family 9 protein [Desulfomonilaceae bacterium]|nr:glycosyltransferase family 9 protein [Desulfomonilaceae bacterium]
MRPGALGDTILALPLLNSVRERHPGSRIVFLGTRSYADLVPDWAEFQSVDHSHWTWLFDSADRPLPSHAAGFDAAYVVLNHPKPVITNLKRTGTRVIAHTSSRPLCGEHVVEHIHRGLGLSVPPKIPCLGTRTAQKEHLIWIHPGSGGPAKCAPLDWLIRFSEALREHVNWPRIVTAGEEDAFLKNLPDWKILVGSPCTRLLEHQPLDKLRKILRNASLFIGNDSGMSHLAAALGVPAMVFYVSTDPTQWAPWVPSDQLGAVDMRGQDFADTDIHRLVSQAIKLIGD